MKQSLLRNLPKIDELLRMDVVVKSLEDHPRRLVVESLRQAIERFRLEILEETRTVSPTVEEILGVSLEILGASLAYSLRPVINGSGIIIHTNLGRSLLSESVMDHVRNVSTHYTNLEFDIEKGARGLRYTHVESLLTRLTGAESALVVNNNAAAVMLSLSTLAYDREIVVSRGELVEIGGSFRIPEVMKISGARLVEVGTTNKTHLKDYKGAVGESTGAILKVHTSNYKIVGFTQEVPIEELVTLGREKDIPVVYDLGSGTLGDLSSSGLSPEPTVLEQIGAGIDVITFSGDKLLGGPQAGIIVGRREYVDAMKRNQLTRALRVDKMTIAALEATLMHYFDEDRVISGIPTQRMIFMTEDEVRRRAETLKSRLADPESVRIDACTSQVGGGTYPLDRLPSACLVLRTEKLKAQALSEALRGWPTPIISRIVDDEVLLDVRTLLDEDFATVAEAIDALVR